MKSIKKATLIVMMLNGFLISFGQGQKRLTIQLKDVPLSRVITAIESETDYTFFINDSKLDLQKTVAVDLRNATIHAILDAAFASLPYVYRVVGKQIVVTQKTDEPAPQQERTITGLVSAADGTILHGVTVRVVGLNTVTTTDQDGRFRIAIPREGAQIGTEYVGYKPAYETVTNLDEIHFRLQPDERTIEEVVVVGYGTQEKKALTGSVSVIKMDEIESGTQTTVSHSLAGKAAGLRVNRVSAQPGGGTRFRIRGEASINASNDPLIVIDGFPVNSGGTLGAGNIYQAGSTDNVLESLNPADIESISVLKDAASTAIYGARAGHGVIIVTTKRGKIQPASVSYSGNYSSQHMSNSFQMLGVQAYMDMRNKQLYEEYLKTNALGIYEGYVSPPSDHNVVPFKPMYTNDQIHRIGGTDWLGQVTRRGQLQQHNLSVNGGNETTRYLTSVNYMNQHGVVHNNNAGRFSARLNLDQRLGRFVSVGITASYAQNSYHNVPLGDGQNEYSGILTSAIQANPAIPVRDALDNYYIDPYRPFVPNPVSLLTIADQTVKDRLLASSYVSASPIEDLTIKLQFGADRKVQKRSNYLPKTTLEGQKHNGSANISQEDGTDYLLDLTADYTVKLGRHGLKALGGYSFQQFNGSGLTAGNRNFLTDGFLYHNIGAGAYEKPPVGSWSWKNAIASYFMRLHYSFGDRYFVEGTLRADGASNFTPENRWGIFPSISAAWTVSEESFMAGTKGWLPSLKVRASYGQTGNSSVGYRIQDFYSVGRNAIFGENQAESAGVFASELGNPSLTWETTSELNVGLDIGLVGNRVTLSAEYFNRRISDLLSTRYLLSYHEVSQIAANIGSTQSRGVEFTANSQNIVRQRFEWSSIFTLAHYNDRWHTRDPDWKPAPYQRVNDPIRAWWSYESQGILRPGDAPPAAQADLLPGMVILKDQNDDGIINQHDMVYMDNGDPKLVFGLNNRFRYDRFDLNLYFYGETGRKRGASYRQGWTRMDNGQNVSVMAYEAFDSANTASNHPTYIRGGYGWGNHYVQPIHFVRCGSINLGYNIPDLGKRLRNFRIYLDVNNPFVITNWTGIDPETDNMEFPYPNIRSYNMGINLTF